MPPLAHAAAGAPHSTAPVVPPLAAPAPTTAAEVETLALRLIAEARKALADKIRAYRALGIDTFILSGYPHREECERFASLVMPLLRDA